MTPLRRPEPEPHEPGPRTPVVVVDARGLRCPLPVIELARAARSAAPGTVLTVLSTDPAARHDVPAWARMRGHDLVEVEDGEGASLAITVRTHA